MRAALVERQGEPLVIREDVEIADPRPGQVKVRVTNCGVCHSDLSIAEGSFPSPVPIVLGHEAAGIVESVGDNVHHVAPGDPVVLTSVPPCGTCYFCVRGDASLCVDSIGLQTNAFPDGTTGLSRAGETIHRGLNLAAFAEYVVCTAGGAVKIPAEVPLDVACVIGCAVQTGVGAVLNTARVEEGATVLVMGLGGIGLSVVQGARVAGAAAIIVSDPVPNRREAAKALGATHLLDPRKENVATCVREITGVGADYAFETAGSATLINMGMAATRNGGSIVCVGAAPIEESLTISPAVLLTISEKKLLGCVLGSCNSLREIPRLVALWQSGQLDLEALVTARRPLEEINEAMDDLRASRGIRTVLSI